MLTEQQIEARKTGIGASECAVVLGLSKYKTPYQLWLEKTGQQEPDDLSDNKAVHWGNVLEPVIAEEFTRQTGLKVIKVPETLRSEKYPFILCHLDGITEDRKSITEFKYATYNGDRFGDETTEQVPIEYYCQVQHQMYVESCEQAYLVVFFGYGDFKIYTIKRNDEFINNMVIELRYFWHCVTNNTPPALRTFDDAKLAFTKINRKTVHADPAIINAIEKYKDVNEKEANLKKEKEKLKAAIAIAMADSELLEADGRVLATWKPNKNGRRDLKIQG